MSKGDSRSVGVGHRGSYPVRGSNARSTATQKTQRINATNGGGKRTVERAGQGGRGDISPATNALAKMVYPLGPNNKVALPDPPKK